MAQHVADPEESLTYAELDARSRQFAGVLSSRGVGYGDHVTVIAENDSRYLEIAWGALLVGAYLTTVSTHSTVDDAAYIVDNSGSSVVVASHRMAEVVGGLPERLDSCKSWLMFGGVVDGFGCYEDALAVSDGFVVDSDTRLGDYMFYSSGTTGRPKGILRPLAGRTVDDGTNFDGFLSRKLGVGRDSVYLSPAPLYHSAPLASVVAATSLGATVVVMRKFDAELSLRLIERYSVTHSQWVPTMFVRLLRLSPEIRGKFDLTSHSMAVHSAAPCPVHVKKDMMDWWGPIIHEYYNGTENVGATYVGPTDWLAHPGTVGRPLGFRVHVCDDDGRELPRGQTGRIFVERDSATFAYHGDAEKTRNSRHPSHDNWMTLDDVGFVDADGFLFLTDRASFMIITGGVNVYPREIEDCLLRHPAVGDVGVFGVDDEEMGERVIALVEPVDGFAPSRELHDELRDFAYSELAGPKRPRTIEFVERLPRTESGKLSKKDLRADYKARNQLSQI
ncbi:AMP-binding protein [Rhodococcus ruber]|uniref:AMP-binding protein n=1 Tax=Rhodococcus ruber TaxID=1830 RepID=A0ABT4MEP1_9NOCA|nr:AMP-binding protein [Rhodococcus ruber]MCZ4519459.1 AMP-binding protein [Rhodococcus ruber]